MEEIEKKEIEDIIQNLMKLDKKSLLLISNGAKLLVSRQCLDSVESEDKNQKNINEKVS